MSPCRILNTRSSPPLCLFCHKCVISRENAQHENFTSSSNFLSPYFQSLFPLPLVLASTNTFHIYGQLWTNIQGKNSQCLWPQPTLDPLLQSRPISKDLWFGRSIVQGCFPTVPPYVSIYLNIPPTPMSLVCVPDTSIMCTMIYPFICASFSHSVILDIGVIK